jgi:pilus assembly protein CpaE
MAQIRVLIVDDHRQTLETITRMLQFEADIHIVGAVGTAREAVQLAREGDPEVVLLDSHLPDMDVVEVITALLQAKPLAEIILLLLDPDPEFIRKAMRSGAADFITKPPPTDKLLKTIREAPDRRQKKLARTGPLVLPPELLPQPSKPQGQGKLITVYSGKGGVGCTTLATNLALQLHDDHSPAVLVDANLQYGDALVLLNQPLRFSIGDLVGSTDQLESDLLREILQVHESGLRVLAAPPSPEGASRVSPDDLRKILNFLREEFAFTVVDTASSLDEITLTVLEMADLILTVVTPEITAIKNARHLTDALDALGVRRDRLLAVLNQVGRKDDISTRSVTDHLRLEVAAEIPFDRAVVLHSINRGRPLVLDGRGHPLTRSMIILTELVKQKLLKEPQEAEA